MFSIAHAQAATQQGSIMSFLPLIVLFVVLYFFLVRPQKKRTQAHQELINNLQKGDEVLSSGGIMGKIVSLDDSTVNLEIATDVTIKVQRQSVVNLLPKGTLKS